MTNSDGGTPGGPYEQQTGSQPSNGYPQQGGGYPQQGGHTQQGGYPQQSNGYPQQGGYPSQQGGYPSQQGGYPQQGVYPQQPNAAYGSPYPPAATTNTLAIITIIAAFVMPLVGIITGHIALGQLKTSGEQGAGLAKAGLIISYVYSGLVAILLVISLVAPFLIFAAFVPFWSSVPTSP